MNIRKIVTKGPVFLLVITAAFLLAACASVMPSASLVNIQAEIDKAVQATLVAMQVEQQLQASPTATTEVLPSPTPTATATPLPTATPMPVLPTSTPETNTEESEASSSASIGNVTIVGELDTNCRTGPSQVYNVVGYLLEGATSTVQGREPDENWWYIKNPSKSEGNCWVWDGSTDVEGDTDNLPVIEPPPVPKYYHAGYSQYWCGNYSVNWKNFKNCKKNDVIIIKGVKVNCGAAYCYTWKPTSCCINLKQCKNIDCGKNCKNVNWYNWGCKDPWCGNWNNINWGCKDPWCGGWNYVDW